MQKWYKNTSIEKLEAQIYLGLFYFIFLKSNVCGSQVGFSAAFPFADCFQGRLLGKESASDQSGLF
ncbi:hypothetical protein DF947_09415 [Pedobacter paludis]|uniref:Uncharacterized protein n=1 Tax=Pedobacter paludis TaxID=2203212 RepID=A0A317EYS7_9SPHI|nr:hypothetical protein DF947_09415 [Pedobacter paludis]